MDATNVKIEKSTKNGMDIRIASGNFVDNKKAVKGNFYFAVVFGDKKAYQIAIKADVSESILATSAARITDSLTVLK